MGSFIEEYALGLALILKWWWFCVAIVSGKRGLAHIQLYGGGGRLAGVFDDYGYIYT